MIIHESATDVERAEARVAYWTMDVERCRKGAECWRKRLNRARSDKTKWEAGKEWHAYCDAYDLARYQLACAEGDLKAALKRQGGERDA